MWPFKKSFQFGLFCLLPLVSSCGSAPPPSPSSPAAPGPKESAQAETPAVELTVDEEQLRKKLVEHTQYLTDKVGERNSRESWQLAEAADYIAGQLESMGFSVERHGYETEEVAAQNMSVTIPGGIRGDQLLLIGAHYDSPVGNSGYAEAVDVAVLLELARLMRKSESLRSLRLSFFSMGESPHGDGEARGARQYLRSMDFARKRSSSPGFAPEAQGTQAAVVGFLSLERMGALRAESAEGGLLSTQVGLVSSLGSEPMRERLVEVLSGEGIERAEMSFTEFSKDRTDSDAHAFHSLGVPVVVLRGKEGSKLSVGRDELSESARIAMRLRWAIGQMIGERMTNDAMLTPGGVVVR